jgi:hypothetical protein
MFRGKKQQRTDYESSKNVCEGPFRARMQETYGRQETEKDTKEAFKRKLSLVSASKFFFAVRWINPHDYNSILRLVVPNFVIESQSSSENGKYQRWKRQKNF